MSVCGAGVDAKSETPAFFFVCEKTFLKHIFKKKTDSVAPCFGGSPRPDPEQKAKLTVAYPGDVAL